MKKKKVIAQTYIKEYMAYVFFKTFYGFRYTFDL